MEEASSYTVVESAPPLSVTNEEMAAMDEAIGRMAKLGKRRGLSTGKLTYDGIVSDQDLLKRADGVISDALVSIKSKVKEDTAEKLYERIIKTADAWPNQEERPTLVIVFFRFMDTIKYLTAYRGKYRGRTVQSLITKEEALAELKARGLTKR